MRKLIESIEAAQITTEERRGKGDPNGYLKAFIEIYGDEDPMGNGVSTEELIDKAVEMGGGNPKKSSDALYKLTSQENKSGGTAYGDTDLSDGLKHYMIMDKLTAAFPEKDEELYQAWENSGGDVQHVADVMPEMKRHIAKMM